MELKFHGKLKFHKHEFQNSGKFLIVSQTMVDRQIFPLKMVFGHLAQTHVYVCLETNPRTLLLKFAPLQITDPG